MTLALQNFIIVKAIIRIAAILFMITLGVDRYSQAQTIIDIDGNAYETMEIGDQIWMKENLKTEHYADGSDIPDVKVYENKEENNETYGCLYTWDAAMKNSTQEGAQGICPDGWHIPSDLEWDILSDYLGGNEVASGKLKESGIEHWKAPNADATNESGFTALPGGEHDDVEFRLLGEYAVMWSSTETSSLKAKYRYMAYDDGVFYPYNYFKSFYYSVRCIKNTTTKINRNKTQGLLIYPNPFDQMLGFEMQQDKEVLGQTKATVYDQKGNKQKEIALKNQSQKEDLHFLAPGIYLIKIDNGNCQSYQKVIKR